MPDRSPETERRKAKAGQPEAEYPDPMRSVCVFCGSSPGRNSRYRAAARQVGSLLAAQGLRLVYGGGRVGLMGELAEAATSGGGRVTGVIPEALCVREVAFEGLADLRVVSSMHERKALMAQLSDAFLALPGGAGTLEEFFEVWTWAQLGIHRKPCGLLNIGGYFDGLLTFLDHAVGERFVREAHRAMVMVDTDPQALLDRLSAYTAPDVPKWLDRAET
jgi:uncharacterized protein (TIGR00730 family)